MSNTVKKNSLFKKENIFSYISLALVFLAHIAILVFVLLTARYYALELNVAISAILFVFVILIIADIIVFVGVRYNDNILNTIASVIAVILLITSIGTSVYVSRLNSSIDNVLDNSGEEQFETIAGTFVSYKKTFNDISELAGKKVGILYETNVGTGSLGQEELSKKNIEPLYVQFSTMDDLLFGLIEEEVDASIFPSSYRQRYANDDEVDFDRYLGDLHDFYSFEKEVKTGDNIGKNIDLSSEPFNILLIGFAPETADNSYGLSDAIIIASVNPKEMRVSLTSIARDSYVPISCYGGAKDKINAARGNSRACLIDTVNELMDTDINLYMEVNFQGVVDIVDALGGIIIDNPVEFVGQSPSVNRGEMFVYVPAGQFNATGEQALAFVRERKHMPNGDFDRQQHQQEAILSIARKLIDLKDVNAALKVMEAAGNNISTNLSLNQLTGIFNYILNVKNYTGFKTSDVITIDNMRVTGYPSWTYNYSLHLPLWIYKLYNGSIAEARNHINQVLGKIDLNTIHQDEFHRFFTVYPYFPDTIYSETFDEPEVHEKMPDFVPLLTKYTYEEALAWAKSMGVTLNVTTINDGDSDFDSKLQGRIIDQSPKQGALVMENPVVYITRMGYESKEITVVCETYQEAIDFAKEANLNVKFVYEPNDGTHEIYELAYTEPAQGTTFEEGEFDTLIIHAYGCPKGQEFDNEGNCVIAHEHHWGEWEIITEPTCEGVGERKATCQDNPEHIVTEEIPALGHDWQVLEVIKEATCNEAGVTKYKCNRCEAEAEINVEASGHNFVDGICDRCGEADPNYTPPENNEDNQQSE